jgi:recombination protein RecA
MPSGLAHLRSQIEQALRGRVIAPFDYHDRSAAENVSTGIDELDLLTGGLPRGALTEVFGPGSSGRATLFISALSVRTANEEECALIDAGDSFDPASAQAAGADLRKLLWIRCRKIEHALRAADLILQGGGFGFVCVDLGGVSRETARKIPLDTWFRFRRAVENTRTVLLALEQEANAKTCASLVLKLAPGRVHWSSVKQNENGRIQSGGMLEQPFARLLDGMDVRAEVVRSRVKPVTRLEFRGNHLQAGTNGVKAQEATFRASSAWKLSRDRLESRQK